MIFLVRYKSNGKILQKKFRAENREILEQKLQNYICLEVREIANPFAMNLLAKNVKLKELLSAFYQLRLGIRANLPLSEALRQTLNFTKNPALKKQFQNVENALNSGKSLALSFKEAKFNDFICAMIEIGDKSGKLVDCLALIIEGLKRQRKNEKTLIKIMLYPFVVTLLMICVFLGITLFVLPQFESLFLSFGNALPFATKSLIFMKILLKDYGILLFFTLFLFVFFGYSFYQKSQNFKEKCDYLFLKLPLLGKILFFYQSNQFLLTFYWLYKNGVDLKESLSVSVNALSNAFLHKKMQEVYPLLKQGIDLGNAFARSGIWDNITLQLLNGARDGEGFVESLEMILELHKEELESKTEQVLGLLEPMMILFLGLLVLWLALGIFLPLWELPMQIGKEN